jgi:methylenetetrahydrofolate dehydrogenase (NADP+) / methenyltetrahydrofolate cyclohydrolase
MAIILDGKAVATQIQNKLKEKVAQLKKPPHLAVILIGDDPASQIYVRNKQKACDRVGISTTLHRHPSTMSESELINLIQQLNQDKKTNGILLQLPIPSHLPWTIFDHIAPHKDVDGLHPYNLGLLAQNRARLRPCTPKGIMRLLEAYQIKLSGLNAVVLGRSNIVGRPMALELINAHCTVTVCHRETMNLQEHVARADLLICATGVIDPIQSSWIKQGIILIDVGIHYVDHQSLHHHSHYQHNNLHSDKNREKSNHRIRGDIDFHAVEKNAAYISPVPGGVGPMTIAMLLENLLLASEY